MQCGAHTGEVMFVELRAFARGFMALASLAIVTLVPAASWNDDSHYVSLGTRAITLFALTRR
jgi:hypothetical protein